MESLVVDNFLLMSGVLIRLLLKNANVLQQILTALCFSVLGYLYLPRKNL